MVAANTARQTITAIVEQSIKPLARAAHFKKKGFSFHRRQGDLIQVVNVQLSVYNSGSDGGFFVNISLAFDRLTELEGKIVNEHPPEYGCHFRRRMENFCPDAPREWIVNAETDISLMAATLSNNFQTVLGVLDAITSIPSFLVRNLTLLPGNNSLLAQLYYVSGDLDAARQAVENEANNRRETVQEIIERYHLHKLSGENAQQ